MPFQFGTFTIQVLIKLPRIVSPTTIQPMDEVSFKKYLQCLPMIWAICVVEDVSIRLTFWLRNFEQSGSVLQFYLSYLSARRYCIVSRVVFYNVTTEHDSACVLLKFWFQLCILEVTYVHWSLCASRITTFLLLTFSKLHAGIVSSFSHSLSTAAFASGIFILCGIGINLCTRVQCDIEVNPLLAMWFSWFFGWEDSTRCLVDSMRFHHTLIHCFWSLLGCNLRLRTQFRDAFWRLFTRHLAVFFWCVFVHSCFSRFWAAFYQFSSILLAIHDLVWKLFDFCQSPPGPHFSFWRLVFQKSEVCESFRRIWQMSARIDNPVIVNSFLLHHVQISMSRPSNINVFQWNRECFSLRHVELGSRFIVMTIDKSPWIDQKSARASASSVDSAGWESPDSPWSSLLKSSLLTDGSRLRVDSRNS